MEGDCNVYAHSSLWMRPTGEWSINAKMVYRLSDADNTLYKVQRDIEGDYYGMWGFPRFSWVVQYT